MERLECYFGSLVGANIYITPHDSQGLPPHHDDIEAFVVQLEGIKRWLLYAPTSIDLPDSYELAHAPLGPPTHDITLQPGDILYFPRGVVHQARTPSSSTESVDYSTHITISTYQKL
jgi:ribosomal protein L16 Arg81 hydroxylase